MTDPTTPARPEPPFTPEQEARIREIAREEAEASVARFDDAVGRACLDFSTRSLGAWLGIAEPDSPEGTA